MACDDATRHVMDGGADATLLFDASSLVDAIVADGPGHDRSDGRLDAEAGVHGDVTMFTVMVRREGDGPAAIDLGDGPCTERVCFRVLPSGSTITVSISPNAQARLVGLTDSPCPGASPCTFTVFEDRQLVATINMKHNLIFSSSETFQGNIGSPEEADALCKLFAGNSGLGDHGWRAWLSSPGQHVRDRIAPNARGWVRPDGVPVADALSDLISAKLLNPVNIDELGNKQPAGRNAWTATQADGTFGSAQSAQNISCDDWTNTTAEGSAGGVYDVGSSWTDASRFSCDRRFSLYCLGTDRDLPLAVQRAAGRVAFISKALFDPTSGVLGADALCSAEAAAASLSGSFKAYLSTTGFQAHTRFDLAGPPWIRVDGVPWISPANSLNPSAGGPLTGLNVTADGGLLTSRQQLYVHTGGITGAFGNGEDATCMSWSTAEGKSLQGGSHFSGSQALSCCSGPCSNEFFEHRVYCLQL